MHHRLLGDAYLRWASFRATNLRSASLRGVDLHNANFHSAELIGTDFGLTHAGSTNFANVGLSHAIGLETLQHEGPSPVAVDTIYKSKGKIPEVFLRGCGVPEEFIAYIGLMVGWRLSITRASSATRPRTKCSPTGCVPTCRRRACGADLLPMR